MCPTIQFLSISLQFCILYKQSKLDGGKARKEANSMSQTLSILTYICKTGMDVVFRFSLQYNSPFFGYSIKVTKMHNGLYCHEAITDWILHASWASWPLSPHIQLVYSWSCYNRSPSEHGNTLAWMRQLHLMMTYYNIRIWSTPFAGEWPWWLQWRFVSCYHLVSHGKKSKLLFNSGKRNAEALMTSVGFGVTRPRTCCFR